MTDLTARALGLMKRIEVAAYPAHQREIASCATWGDLVKYCDSEYLQVCMIHGAAYLLATEDEIVDLAASRPLTLRELYGLVLSLRPGRYAVDLCRSTTYRLVRFAARRRGRISFRELHEWDWGGTPMVHGVMEIAA